MSDLATWYLAQLEADEKRENSRRSLPRVAGQSCPVCDKPVLDHEINSLDDDQWWLGPCGHEIDTAAMDALAPSKSMADPFVLADIAAKRRIVELYMNAVIVDEEGRGHFHTVRASRLVLQQAVHLLALPYADRPGYDPTWAPEVA